MDILDTRDLDKEIEELETTEEEYNELFDEYLPTTSMDNAAQKASDESGLDHEDRHRLNALRAFKEELEGYCDWMYGETLVAEDDFTEYAEELASDIYSLETHWPYNHIDWDAAAEALKVDYTEADLEGSTYYVRMS